MNGVIGSDQGVIEEPVHGVCLWFGGRVDGDGAVIARAIDHEEMGAGRKKVGDVGEELLGVDDGCGVEFVESEQDHHEVGMR